MDPFENDTSKIYFYYAQSAGYADHRLYKPELIGLGQIIHYLLIKALKQCGNSDNHINFVFFHVLLDIAKTVTDSNTAAHV